MLQCKKKILRLKTSTFPLRKINVNNEIDKHNRMTRVRKRTVLSFTLKKNKEIF